EDVTVTAVATYDDETVGTGKTITVVYTLSGADAGNYTAPADFVVTDGEITTKSLTIADPTLTKTKTYDGTASADVTAGSLVGVATGEDVTVTAVATYDDETVGTGKMITVVYTLSGADAGNYTAPADFVITDGEITTKSLTIVDPTLTKTKTYDGTASADVTAGSLVGVATGEDVTVTAVATYDDETVGTGKTITVVYTLSGADAGNYTAPANFVVTDGEITTKSLTIADPTLTKTKTYDGTTSADVTAGALSGVATGEDVTVTAVATYDDETVGTGKTITVVYTLSGADAGNYTAPADFVVTDGEITGKSISDAVIADIA
ncbi:YDG domain-containing protein, partial [Belliella aquatica]